ncbi:MAG: TolC family protein [Chitinophaga sp.]
MKPFLPLLLLTACLQASAQQPFTLDSAWASAQRHYPLLKQQEVTDQVTALQLRNIRTNYLPQVELNGKASYQSEVVSIPIKLPNVNIPTLPKDQYNATVDVRQMIYDGGATAGQRELQLAQQQADKQKVEVEMHQLRQQVMQVFFNALIWEEHINARKQMIEEVKQRMERVQAGVDNGTVLASQVDILKAELLKAGQQLEEAVNGKATAINMLALLTGKGAREIQTLQMPEAAASPDQQISRPELELYRLQTGVLRQRSKLTNAKSLPKISAFAQGGYGRPGLNVLDNKFDFYYIGGLRLQWTLWNWRYNRTERDILRVQEQSLQSQSETFTLQTRSQLLQQSGEIATLASAMEKDKDIVVLRTKVKDVSAAQLDNGVLTVHDYLTDLFAETQAVITQKTHEIQWVYATIHYQVTKGY